MRTTNRAILSAAALGMAMGISGTVLASPLETRHNVAELAAALAAPAPLAQAGSTGPETLAGDMAMEPSELLDSTFWLAQDLNAFAATGQAGRPGPELSPADSGRAALPHEQWNSVVDLPSL